MNKKRGFGDIFLQSWKEFKENWKSILIIFLILSAIPSLILTYFFIPINLSMQETGNVSLLNTTYAVIYGLLFFASVILSFWLSIAVLYIGFNSKKRVRAGEALRNSLNYFWKYLGLVIVLFFALFGLFLLLIVPAIIFYFYWSFAIVVLVAENRGIIESMKRSKKVVKGSWWRVFFYSILLFLVFIAISIIISIPASVINFASAGLQGENAFTIYVNQVFSLAGNFITMPLGLFFLKNFYFSLVKEKGLEKK
jgi:hypothetical protein